MPFEPLRKIVARSIVAPGRNRDLLIARVFAAGADVVTRVWGEERAVYVAPRSFKDGVLKWDVRSPAAAQQLRIDAPKLKNEINRQLGSALVKEIRIQTVGF